MRKPTRNADKNFYISHFIVVFVLLIGYTRVLSSRCISLSFTSIGLDSKALVNLLRPRMWWVKRRQRRRSWMFAFEKGWTKDMAVRWYEMRYSIPFGSIIANDPETNTNRPGNIIWFLRLLMHRSKFMCLKGEDECCHRTFYIDYFFPSSMRFKREREKERNFLPTSLSSQPYRPDKYPLARQFSLFFSCCFHIESGPATSKHLNNQRLNDEKRPRWKRHISHCRHIYIYDNASVSMGKRMNYVYVCCTV